MRTDTIVTEAYRDPATGDARTLTANENVRISARRMLSAFVHFKRHATATATIGDFFIDKSNLEDPSASDDGDWILDGTGTDMLPGTNELNVGVSIAQEDMPKWIRIRGVIAGGGIQIEALVAGKMEV